MTTWFIYVDGSSVIRNGQRHGGIGIYIENNNQKISKYYNDKNATNQRMELMACLLACQYYELNRQDQDTLVVRSDSMYSINCVTQWSSKWQANNWQRKVGKKDMPVLHLDIIKELFEYYKKYNIKFEHVKGHQKQPAHDSKSWLLWNGNDIADKLSRPK
jgi:ribonuclease HI